MGRSSLRPMRIASAAGLAVAVTVAVVTSAHGSASGVPRGFSPEGVAATGTRNLWVLGDYKCGKSYCNALVRSSDAGKQFSRADLPPLPAQGTVPTVVFANGRDGFAYVEDGGPLYVTRDGGESWHREGPAGVVGAFATAGGYAYLVAGLHRFERSPVGRDSWQRVKVAVPHHPFSLAARGSNVWFLGPPRRHRDLDTIAISSDYGRSFTSQKGPCVSELGGTLSPSADRVVWAVCPTGSLSQIYRSADDGRSFRLVRSPGETNGAEVAPFSSRAAVLDVGGIASLYRTTDGGARWTAVRSTPQHGTASGLRSTTKRLGFAVIETWTPAERLWRTTDAGATWHPLPIR